VAARFASPSTSSFSATLVCLGNQWKVMVPFGCDKSHIRRRWHAKMARDCTGWIDVSVMA
jgi:hypothetical protein